MRAVSDSDDIILAILRKIAGGRYDDRDIDYLKKSMRSHDRNVIQFADTNVYLEQGGVVYVNSTAIHGADAEAIRDAMQDLLDEYDGDIPRGSLRSLGGLIYGIGLLVCVGSVALGMINGALGGNGSSRHSFPNIFIGFFIGAILSVIGQFLKDQQKQHGRPASRDITTRTHARAGRTSRSLGGGLSKLVEVVGIAISFVGFYMFASPAFPLSTGEMTITQLAAKGWPPRTAMEGFALLAVGMVVIALGKVIGGWSKR